LQLDPASLSASKRYRLMIGLIVPRPIAFVSTRDAAGRTNLAPFSYFMGVASEPPVVAISVHDRADAPKDTARNILETGEFVVNAATEDLAKAVNEASGDWAAGVDEFALTGLTPAPSVRVKPPRVAEAAWSFECRLYKCVDVGESPRLTRLVLGEIVWVHLRDGLAEGDAAAGFTIDAARLRPIARLGQNLYTPLGERFAMDRPRVPEGEGGDSGTRGTGGG
jgi:flavin reductase (DIM6/NTAB) family NADH-FMN oxidoreductase RutF